MIEEVSRNEMLSTIHYMTEHFPYRLAGSPCEAAASRYVTERLKQYGLEVENKEFYTYNSDPMYSKVTVLEPEMEIDSLPCAHIRATKPEGEIFELIYVGNGDYAAYKDIDVTGKMVLVEVSSGIAAGRAAWRRPSSRCIWQAFPCAGWRTSRRHCGAARSRPPPSAS